MLMATSAHLAQGLDLLLLLTVKIEKYLSDLIGTLRILVSVI
jgi:hypothetical protein